MIHDSVTSLPSYSPICQALSSLDGLLFSYAEEMETFEMNSRECTLFVPVSGECTIATGWREERYSRDVTAAVRAQSGSFVLFLPGERFIFSGSGKCRVYTLE